MCWIPNTRSVACFVLYKCLGIFTRVFTSFYYVVDGKVKTFWSNTDNSQKCYLCQCGEKDLRQRSSPKFNIKNLEALKFGFSPLHCLLRSFDWFIKTKTYSDIKSYAAYGKVQQGLVATQKAFLQDRFRTYFKIKLFMPRPGGGTFIDGNAVRDVFRKPALFSRLIDFPEDLIRDFYTLLMAVVSGADVKPDTFRDLANSWLDRFHGNPSISWNTLRQSIYILETIFLLSHHHNSSCETFILRDQ